MAESKEFVASAIASAQADLLEALVELEKIPSSDAGSLAYHAHALNNYLTVTGGTVELISMHLADHPDAQLRVWVEGVQHATNLMGRIVTQLMSASVSSDTKLRFDKVDLPILVRRVCDYYQRGADRKSIRVTADSTGDVPPVRTDRVAVAAVLDNLVSNAVKYSPPGKQVGLLVRGEEHWAVCEVRDEGPGLSAADQSRLFQRGARLTPRPTGGEPSMGYGLAIARELVEKLGGEIWCESVLGRGCSFCFRLPAYQEPVSGSGSE